LQDDVPDGVGVGVCPEIRSPKQVAYQLMVDLVKAYDGYGDEGYGDEGYEDEVANCCTNEAW